MCAFSVPTYVVCDSEEFSNLFLLPFTILLLTTEDCIVCFLYGFVYSYILVNVYLLFCIHYLEEHFLWRSHLSRKKVLSYTFFSVPSPWEEP